MPATNQDLERVLARMHDERASLGRVIGRLDADGMTAASPGGWTIARVLRHVIESEYVYAKVLAHQCGRKAPDVHAVEPRDGADAVERLSASRKTVMGTIDGIRDETLYRIVRFGHEEYSALSVLENIASHDADHRGQITDLVAEPRRAPGVIAVPGISIRPAVLDDLAAITGIYNHYITDTPVTFDLEAVTVEQRGEWFAQFHASGRHRLLVATDGQDVVGYAGSHQFRTKAAYDTTVETTIYLAPEACGRRIGQMLYQALFATLGDEDIRMMIAGITLPNEASIALHERFGFARVGVMHAVGRKFGQYWDVAWYERTMGSAPRR